ncbi:MAG: DUF5615 family PIN-like protein [Thermomicrobiales bacterium]
MRSVSDICVPAGVHEYLRTRGWGIVRAGDFGFGNQPDENIWAFARNERRVLISAGYDFRRFRQFLSTISRLHHGHYHARAAQR